MSVDYISLACALAAALSGVLSPELYMFIANHWVLTSGRAVYRATRNVNPTSPSRISLFCSLRRFGRMLSKWLVPTLPYTLGCKMLQVCQIHKCQALLGLPSSHTMHLGHSILKAHNLEASSSAQVSVFHRVIVSCCTAALCSSPTCSTLFNLC